MAQASSKSREIIGMMDRATLETALFFAVATLRGIAKGEAQVPPANMDRTVLTVGLLQMAQAFNEAEKEIVVTDVNQAADILKQIASGGTA